MLLFAILRLEYDDGPWRVTVHGPHGNVPNAQKHVHITRKKLSGEYSWNIDGSRHDEHRFPASEQMIKAAKRVAAEALGVSDTSLQFVVGAQGSCRVAITSFAQRESTGRSLARFSATNHELILVFAHEGSLLVMRTER